MKKAYAAEALLAIFGLGPEPDPKLFSSHGRRGRIYGRGSKAYSGPRNPGRKRPVVTAELVKAWRVRHAAEVATREAAAVVEAMKTERRVAVRTRQINRSAKLITRAGNLHLKARAA